MACPRSLPDGCASATSVVVEDASAAQVVVESFLAQIGSVDVDDLALRCSVDHPDGLSCTCLTEVFKLTSGEYLMEFTRMRGDSVLFALVFKLLRAYLATGATPALFPGQLLPRHRRGPANDPAIVPAFVLPSAS